MFKILLLASLVKLLLNTQNFLLCSGIYAVFVTVLGLVFGIGLLPSLIMGLVVMGASTLYFWLLMKFEDRRLLWWCICILGMPIGML